MSRDRLDLATHAHSNAFWSAPHTAPRVAVLVLNASHGSWRTTAASGIEGAHGSELFYSLWTHAQLRVCADGGANRLYDVSRAIQAQEMVPAPDYIKGDLDSLREDVRAFFAAKETVVLEDPGQSTNDLDKCLQLIHQHQEEHCRTQDSAQDLFSVLIFGAMGGRFDQEMQNINALFRWHGKFQQLVLLSDETTARLLEPHVRHVITPNFAFETRTCGLIPVAGTCKETTTSGLKWNLSPGMETGFGGLISSSNHVDDACEQVEVVTSHPLIWTTELKKQLD